MGFRSLLITISLFVGGLVGFHFQFGSLAKGVDYLFDISPEVVSSSLPSNKGITLDFSGPDEFYEWTQQLIHRLPRIEEVKKEKRYHIASDLVVAGQKISEVSKFIQEYPELKGIGMAFFSRCANHTQIVSAVRGLCSIRLRSTYGVTGGKRSRSDRP